MASWLPEEYKVPTGYAGVLVAGAWSGTLSLYEFTMADGSKCGAPCAVDGAACANGKTCECTAHARRNLLSPRSRTATTASATEEAPGEGFGPERGRKCIRGEGHCSLMKAGGLYAAC